MQIEFNLKSIESANNIGAAAAAAISYWNVYEPIRYGGSNESRVITGAKYFNKFISIIC